MNIQKPYRDLIKHSAVYGGGQILARVASFLLLPLYTSYLRPVDYGVIAILDLISGLMGYVIALAMIEAVARYHFDFKSDEKQRQVWWTGMTVIGIMATTLVGMGLLVNDELAAGVLGASVPEKESYVLLMLATIWVGSFGHLPATFLRVHKCSMLFVCFSFGRLCLNIGLNVYFLTVWDLGVKGVLLGNLITEFVNSIALLGIFGSRLGAYAVDWMIGKKLWKFASPLIITGLLATVMQQANRFLLRVFVDLDQVGLFSLAYTLGQGVNSLLLVPFTMIWGVIIYEISDRAEAKEIYVQVFEYFMYGVALVLFGVSLFAKPLLMVMVAPDYWSAYSLVPIICLSFLFFSLHDHFKVPVLLAKQTTAMVPVLGFSVIVNLCANLVLIPLFGTVGAAWAGVITFVAYSFGGFWYYRRIDCYAYPFFRCGLVLVGLITSYSLWWIIDSSQVGMVWSIGLAAIIWSAWAWGLVGRPLVKIMSGIVDPKGKTPAGIGLSGVLKRERPGEEMG